MDIKGFDEAIEFHFESEHKALCPDIEPTKHKWVDERNADGIPTAIVCANCGICSGTYQMESYKYKNCKGKH